MLVHSDRLDGGGADWSLREGGGGGQAGQSCGPSPKVNSLCLCSILCFCALVFRNYIQTGTLDLE